MSIIKKIFLILDKNEKKFFSLILLFTLVVALLEVIGISLVLPLVNFFINNDYLFNNFVDKKISEIFNFSSVKNLAIFYSMTLILVFLIKSILQTILAFFHLKYFTKVHVRLYNKLYNNYIYSDWAKFITLNTAAIMRNFQSSISDFTGKILSYLITLISEIILIITLSVFLLYLYPFVSLMVFVIIFLVGLIVLKLTKTYNYKLGVIRQKYTEIINKHIIQSFRIPKLLKILGKEQKFIDIFTNLIEKETKSKNLQLFIERLPRIWVEFLFLIIILLLVLVFSLMNFDSNEIFKSLLIFSIVSFRIIAPLNKILICVQNIRYSTPALEILSQELKNFKFAKKVNKTKPIILKNYDILIKDLSFKYKNSNVNLFYKLNYKIKSNTSHAIIGKSGVGKSTLADLIMGIHKPDKGKIFIGNKNLNIIKDQWLKKIGYVPQETYILDENIRSNVAIGIPEDKIDDEKILKIFKLLELEELIFRYGFNSLLGDNGIKLSGGQKQRIGIARALYVEPKILILDEAFSALDNKTEKNILNILKKIKHQMTIILISHKKASISFCDNTLDLNK